jgi:hypothetical protein
VIQWINPEETIAVSINYFDIIPDIPTVRDVHVLRSFYRTLIADHNGGLIAVELNKRQQFDIIKTIFKVPQEPSGIRYIGSLTIPFKTCSFVLKVQAVEGGITGMREAAVMDKLLKAGNFDEVIMGADPYDKGFKTGLLMTTAEAQIYDADFPNHPLSQVRNLLSQIEKQFQWEPTLEKLQHFDL